jgi:hypothetical protein
MMACKPQAASLCKKSGLKSGITPGPRMTMGFRLCRHLQEERWLLHRKFRPWISLLLLKCLRLKIPRVRKDLA